MSTKDRPVTPRNIDGVEGVCIMLRCQRTKWLNRLGVRWYINGRAARVGPQLPYSGGQAHPIKL